MSSLTPPGWGRRGEIQGYFDSIDELKELCEGELPRKIRQFDIRFRLALSLQISFDSSFSYTKTESTRKTYKALMEVNDLWFAYEGLYSLCKSRGITKTSATKSDPFLEETVAEIGLNDISKLLEQRYLAELLSEPTRRQDFCDYVEYLRLLLLDRLKLGC